MPEPVTQDQFRSLKESVTSIADSLDGMVKMQREDRKEFHDVLQKQNETLSKSIQDVDNKRQDSSKVPYPLLSIIFGVMLTIGSFLTWNSQRIEQDSKQRDIVVDQVIQREFTDMKRTYEVNMHTLQSDLKQTTFQLHESGRRFIDLQARNEERIKILFELRNENK